MTMFELLAAETTSRGSLLTPLLLYGIVGVGLYFVMIRPQKRKLAAQRDLLSGLEVGDEVVTAGGMLGSIVDIDEVDDVVTLAIAPGTNVRMLRGGISRRVVDEDDDADADAGDDDANEADRSS